MEIYSGIQGLSWTDGEPMSPGPLGESGRSHTHTHSLERVAVSRSIARRSLAVLARYPVAFSAVCWLVVYRYGSSDGDEGNMGKDVFYNTLELSGRAESEGEREREREREGGNKCP
jgi:hypothetical protein